MNDDQEIKLQLLSMCGTVEAAQKAYEWICPPREKATPPAYNAYPFTNHNNATNAAPTYLGLRSMGQDNIEWTLSEKGWVKSKA